MCMKLIVSTQEPICINLQNEGPLYITGRKVFSCVSNKFPTPYHVSGKYEAGEGYFGIHLFSKSRDQEVMIEYSGKQQISLVTLRSMSMHMEYGLRESHVFLDISPACYSIPVLTFATNVELFGYRDLITCNILIPKPAIAAEVIQLWQENGLRIVYPGHRVGPKTYLKQYGKLYSSILRACKIKKELEKKNEE